MILPTEELVYGWIYLYARVFGVFLLLPFFSGAVALVPRALVSALFAAALFEQAGAHETIQVTAVLSEVLLGVALSIPVLLVCETAEGIAELFDAGRGQTLAMQYGASGDSLAGVSGFALRFGAWTMLVLAGALERLVALIGLSVSAIPPGTATSLSITSHSMQSLKIVVLLVTHGFLSYLPFAVVFLAVDLTAAGCQMILPAAHLHVESFIVKSLVGGSVVYIVLSSGRLDTVLGLILSFIEMTGRRLIG